MLKLKFFITTLLSIIIVNSINAQELQSWNEPMRSELIKMVNNAPEKNRVVTFDMDGTMISESPTYDIAVFTMQYSDQEIKSKDDLIKALLALAKDEVSYKKNVDEFFTKHKVRVYQPMMELVEYFKANEFKVVLCTASEQYFGRKAMETAFPIFDDVIGTNFKVRVNEYEGKVENLNDKGYKPMFAFGNSAGDYQMMEYASNGGFLVIHDDEKAGEYDKPDEYMEECKEKGFNTINISDWKTIFR